MSDEGDLAPVASEDYETIEAAVMETGRGRWFLKEFARRNRHAETAHIHDVLARIENRLTSSPQNDEIQRTGIDQVLRLMSEAEAAVGDMQGSPSRSTEELQSADTALDDTLEALKAITSTLVAQNPRDRLFAALARRLNTLDAVVQEQAQAAKRMTLALEAMGRAKALLAAFGTFEAVAAAPDSLSTPEAVAEPASIDQPAIERDDACEEPAPEASVASVEQAAPSLEPPAASDPVPEEPAEIQVAAEVEIEPSSADAEAESDEDADDENPSEDFHRPREAGRRIGVRSPALIRSLADLDRLTARERLAVFS